MDCFAERRYLSGAEHILRIDCPDEPGLVQKITGVLFNAGYNVLNNQEFVDLEAKHFFMRTAFEGTAAPDRVISYLQQVLPASAVVKLATTEKQPVVILAKPRRTAWAIS